MAKQPESRIAEAVRELIVNRGGQAIKHHGSAFSRVGEPDIIGCIGGQTVAFEVKQEGKTATGIQFARLMAWGRAGAVIGIVHSATEALAILEQNKL